MIRSFGKSLWSKSLLIALGFLFLFATGYPFCAAASERVGPEVPIWPAESPGSEDWQQTEVDTVGKWPGKTMGPHDSPSAITMVRNVIRPTLTVYKPSANKVNGTAVIIAPGGGLRYLAWDHEGVLVANWLAAKGITAFILKYRLLRTPAEPSAFADFEEKVESTPNDQKLENETQMQKVRQLARDDGLQAVKYLRNHASELGIDPHRIGIIGFSAGAYVALGVIMRHDEDEAGRVDSAALIYGGDMDEHLRLPEGCPLFLAVAEDDPFTLSIAQHLYIEWSAARRPVEFHAFARGGHGFAMINQGLPVDHWIDLYGNWLVSLDPIRKDHRPH